MPVAAKKLVHAVADPRDLYKAYETDVAILGDAKLVLRQLIESLRDRLGKRRPADPAPEIRSLKQNCLAQWQAKLTSNERPITPYRAIREFMRAIPADDAIVTHD